MNLWKRGKNYLMKNKKLTIKRGFSYNNTFLALDENTRKKIIQIEVRLVRLIEQFKLKTEKVKLNKEAEKNIFQDEKILRKYKQIIDKQEITRFYDSQKILLEFFYDRKNDKLYLNNIYIFDKKLSKSNDNKLINLHFFVFLLPLFMIGYRYCIYKDNLLNSERFGLKFFYGLCFYIFLGALFFYFKKKLLLENEYKLKKISFFDSLNIYKYTSNYRRKTALIALLFFSTQFIIVNIIPRAEYSYIDSIIILLLTLFIDLYYIINLFISFFSVTGANITFLALCLTLTFFLGIIKKDNWVLVTLSLALISLIISKDIWRISEDKVNPLNGVHDTKDNEDIVDRNIYILKLIIGSSSMILYSIISMFGDNTIFLDLFNKISIPTNRVCKNSFTGIIFIGLDRVFVIFISYLALQIINGIFKKVRKHSLIDVLKGRMNSVINKISSLVYRGIK